MLACKTTAPALLQEGVFPYAYFRTGVHARRDAPKRRCATGIDRTALRVVPQPDNLAALITLHLLAPRTGFTSAFNQFRILGDQHVATGKAGHLLPSCQLCLGLMKDHYTCVCVIAGNFPMHTSKPDRTRRAKG